MHIGQFCSARMLKSLVSGPQFFDLLAEVHIRLDLFNALVLSMKRPRQDGPCRPETAMLSTIISAGKKPSPALARPPIPNGLPTARSARAMRSASL